MASNADFFTRYARSARVGLALMAVGALAVAAGLARTTTSTPDGKVFVCKYVGTPGVDEHLQTGQNPIDVSINAIQDFQGVGSYFEDAHGRSYVLALDVGQPEPDVSECPGGVPTTTTTVADQPTTTTTVADQPTTTTLAGQPTTTTVAGQPTTTTVADQPTTTTVADPPTTTTTADPPTTSTTVVASEATTTTTAANQPPTTTSTLPGTVTVAGNTSVSSTVASAKGATSNPTVPRQTGSLPFTGSASVPLIALGSVLFASGAAMTVVSRRRRRAA